MISVNQSDVFATKSQLNGIPVPNYTFMVETAIAQKKPGFIPLHEEIARKSLRELHNNLNKIILPEGRGPEDKIVLFNSHADLLLNNISFEKRPVLEALIKTIKKDNAAFELTL